LKDNTLKNIAFLVIFFSMLSSVSAQHAIRFNKIYNVIPGIACYAQRVSVYNDGYALYGETDDSTNSYTKISVTKIDTSGNIMWNKSYGKPGFGYFFGNLPGGGGGTKVPWGGYIEAGIISNIAQTWYRLALFRFDDKGDTLWTRIYNDSTDELGITIKVTRDKKYIVGGDWYYLKGSTFVTMTLKKTDSLGNVIWQKSYQGAPSHYREGLSLDTCKDGGYILCSYDGDTNSECGGSIFIMKTDSAGNPQWTNYIYDKVCLVDPDYVLSLRDGGYLVCGGYDDSLTGNGEQYGKIYLTKISSTGSVKWAKQYGQNCRSFVLFSIKELPNGDIISCGGDSSAFIGCILRTDSNGNEKWRRYYKMESPAEEDYLYDIQLTPDGGFVATGFTYGNTENIWVVKTDSLGCDTVDCDYATSVSEMRGESGKVKVYPNPSNGTFQLVISNYKLGINSTVEIYNVLGEEVYSSYQITQSSNYPIDISSQSNGVYMYRIISETGDLVGEGKVIIQK